jgi:Family of unknown function (DUF5681)
MVWAPGQSGNPRGRPPADHGPVEKLCRALTEEAVETLATIMRSGFSEAARIAASNAILDRGWGKAREPRELRLSDPRQMTDAQLIDIILASGALVPEQLPAPAPAEKIDAEAA